MKAAFSRRFFLAAYYLIFYVQKEEKQETLVGFLFFGEGSHLSRLASISQPTPTIRSTKVIAAPSMKFPPSMNPHSAGFTPGNKHIVPNPITIPIVMQIIPLRTGLIFIFCSFLKATICLQKTYRQVVAFD